EYTKISGGTMKEDVKMVAYGIAFIVGGTTTASIARTMGPLATLIGTPAGAIGLGLLCTPVFPVVGTICGGFAGGVTGYYFSSSFAELSGFIWGGSISSAAAYYVLHDF